MTNDDKFSAFELMTTKERVAAALGDTPEEWRRMATALEGNPAVDVVVIAFLLHRVASLEERLRKLESCIKIN